MQRTLIKDLKGLINQEVRIRGWVQTVRAQKRMIFLIVRDHTGIVQVLIDRNSPKLEGSLSDTLSNLSIESTATIVGHVVENPAVQLGKIEIQMTEFILESSASRQLPIQVVGTNISSLDVRMDWRFLDLRRPEHLLIFKVQTTTEMAMREFWLSEGFVEMHSPKLISSPSESGAELFQLDYFGKTAYLAQSPQFYKQMAMASGFDRVFEIGPVFRANPSFTSRHDTEFVSVDVEMSWISSHEDIMSFEERWIEYVLTKVKEKHETEIADLWRSTINIPALPFPRITMKEAIRILNEKGYTIPPDRKGDLDPQGERLIAQHILEKYNSEFVYVMDYPISVRPFYHMRNENDPTITKSFDLLWKGLEITTGAQREHRYDLLANQALEKGLNLEPIQFYLNFFNYGCPPHGGFGFGLTRMLMIIFNASNVREVTYLYRGPNRLLP